MPHSHTFLALSEQLNQIILDINTAVDTGKDATADALSSQFEMGLKSFCSKAVETLSDVDAKYDYLKILSRENDAEAYLFPLIFETVKADISILLKGKN